MELAFTNTAAVAGVAFLAPLLLGFFPKVMLPAVVLEIVAGIAIGPAGLDWVQVDEPLTVLSTVGLAFLLFLAGLEIDFDKLRGNTARLAGLGFAASFGIAVLVGLGADAAGLSDAPLLVAIILVSTSLGVVVPVLKDAGEAGSKFGQLVIAASSIADFGAIILLSLFFSREATDTGAQVLLIGFFALMCAIVGFGLARAERTMGLPKVLVRLQDTTAQIRVRGAFLLLAVLVALAGELGLEVILGAFAAGAVLTLVDKDQMQTHPQFRTKLDGAGFGIFIPVFFVTSGLKFDLDALFGSTKTLIAVPVFLIGLVLVRGLPALLYRRELDGRETAVAALLQATSLPFIVAATQIGEDLELIDAATSAALIGAGLLSVLIFPLAALTLLANRGTRPAAPAGPPG